MRKTMATISSKKNLLLVSKTFSHAVGAMRFWLSIAATTLCLLLFSACSSPIPGLPDAGRTNSAIEKSPAGKRFHGDEAKYGINAPNWITDEDYKHYILDNKQELVDKYGVDVSGLEVVRWVTPAEFVAAKIQCLVDDGYPASPGTEPGEFYPGMDMTSELWAIEERKCWIRYPEMPDREHGIASDQTKRVMYNYYAVELVACLESKGEKIKDIPSFEVYSQPKGTYDMDWNPYEQLSGEASNKYEKDCPYSPTDGRLDYLYEEPK